VRTVKIYEPDGVQAPVTAGAVLGEVSLSFQGHEYGTVPLVANKGVELSMGEAIQDSVGSIFERIFGVPSDEEDNPSGSLRWLKWAVLGGIGIIVFYVILVIALNRRRRRRNMRASNYRGRKRY
jgi:hypothetical protein